MIIRNLLLVGILLCSGYNAICQTNKALASCTGACCKDSKKDEKTVQNSVTTIGMEGSTKKKPIACKLTSPELQKRKAEVLASLKAKVQKREELPNGYSYLFASTDKNIDEVTNFIKTERICCDFFNFKIVVEDDELWLTITGEEGTKIFITDEMGL